MNIDKDRKDSEEKDKGITLNLTLKKKHLTYLIGCILAVIAITLAVELVDKLFDNDDDHHRRGYERGGRSSSYDRRYEERGRSGYSNNRR